MALFTPSESPAIVVKEIDLSGSVPNIQSTTGAFVGNFGWGPVEEPVMVDNESTLAAVFGNPLKSSPVDFLSAAYFSKYSSSLYVIRKQNGAYNANSAGIASVRVKNLYDWDIQKATLAGSHIFIAKYPGTFGNNISVHICPVHISNTAFNNWTYKSYFDAAPKTSTFATNIGATNDEMHVVVVNNLTDVVLETYPFVSIASNARNADGSNNYLLDVINNKSQYVRMASFGSGDGFPVEAGNTIESGEDFRDPSTTVAVEFALSEGVESSSLGTSAYNDGFDIIADKDVYAVDFLIAPGMSSRSDQQTVVNHLVAIAADRKDCVVVASPARNDVVDQNTANASTEAITTASGFTNSSYLFIDNNYIKVYDKYNDQYIYIPAASSTAGIMAASDYNNAPWYSPAGSRRGVYLGVTNLAYSPTKSQRDALYKAGINPITNIPGSGVLLYGDKTNLGRPSAFDRINVRRLFIVIERAVAEAAKNVMFEFNDEFTRAEFVNVVEPFLRDVKGRRGIYDFRVVCDETNNTADVIDRNEFIASIFIKPARSINYITLNFVAVRTGVNFDEVVGLV